ncbi:flavin monoamine oxidase family protein [Alkalinema pantanalense CENA528]|uniref:flavin monoamine oxidase family protein n=1 Tax=Alkalinema pantanalense TaxID=1620705 RepID=UPI003D6EA88C
MAHTRAFRQLIRLFLQAQQANLQAQGQPPTTVSVSQSWKRRKFLKLATIAGGSALTTQLLSHPPLALGGNAPKIAIIGGGIAGLNAAYQLKKLGITATVYEARSRLGGRMQSVTGAIGPGLVSDLGGSLINTDHEDMLDLVQDFGLTLFNRQKDPTIGDIPHTGYYFNNARRYEAEVADKLRPLARQISRDARLLDQDFDTYAPQFDRLSVKAYLDLHQNKIPDPFIRELIENTIRTEYGVEPINSSALQLLFVLPIVKGDRVELLSTSDEVFVVKEGSGAIIDRLGQALAGQIRTQMVLTQIQSYGNQYRLTFKNGQVIDADYVLFTVPFTVARNINFQVELPANFRKMMRELNLGSNEKILAGFSQKLWRQPFGFGSELWTDLGFSEVWDDTQRQPRNDGALSFYFGGREVSAIQSGSAQTQGRRMVGLMNQVIPNITYVATDRFIRTSWTTDPFTQGGYTNFQPGQLTEFSEFIYIEADRPEERQEVRFGNLLFAGEHLSDAFYGFMNGAAETGRLAALSILRQLGKVS